MKKYPHLKTPLNYSAQIGVSRQYISERLRKGKIAYVEIDGIRFVDTSKIKGYEEPKEETPKADKPAKQKKGGYKAL